MNKNANDLLQPPQPPPAKYQPPAPPAPTQSATKISPWNSNTGLSAGAFAPAMPSKPTLSAPRPAPLSPATPQPRMGPGTAGLTPPPTPPAPAPLPPFSATPKGISSYASKALPGLVPAPLRGLTDPFLSPTPPRPTGEPETAGPPAQPVDANSLANSTDPRTRFLVNASGSPVSGMLSGILPDSWKGTVDKGLGWVKNNITPQNFASFAGLAKPFIEPFMGAPLGALGLTGLYGALRGGESFAAAEKMFRPITDKLGLNLGGPSPTPPPVAPPEQPVG